MTSTPSAIKVLVLHRDAFTRTGLEATFSRYPDLEIVSNPSALNADAPSLWHRDVADVVVADYESGIRLAKWDPRRNGEAGRRIVIVSSNDREGEIRFAMACGIRGYLLIGCALDELANGVRDVYRGIPHLSATVAQRLAESLACDALTVREEAVLRLVVDGMNNKEIARKLSIAVGTVKSHLKGIFDKLDVDSRTQAVRVAERRGMLFSSNYTFEVEPDASDKLDISVALQGSTAAKRTSPIPFASR